MAENVRNQIAQKIIDASYFAITCDSATDFSSREQESIRIRLAYHGAVFDHLVGFEAPGANVNAEGIWEAILRGVSKVGITADTIKSKMSSIALDGASVNIGKHRSVVKLCQNLNPAILPVHCFSHRLELAFWDTAKSVVTFKKSLHSGSRDCILSTITVLNKSNYLLILLVNRRQYVLFLLVLVVLAGSLTG